jgi:hypothetical protein
MPILRRLGASAGASSVDFNMLAAKNGAFAGLPLLVEGIGHKNIMQIITGASIFLTGLFAADAKKD